MKYIKKWLPTVLLFIVVFSVANMWQTRNLPDGVAAEFKIMDLNNVPHHFTFENKTKPVLLHFFATWCPVCELENDTLNSLAKDHELIVIAMQSGDADNIRQYQQEHQLIMPVYNDESGNVSRLYGVTGVPTSFIINAKGNITASTIGYTSELGLRFRLWLSQFQ